ncbi:7-fold repeat in clathrin and VPS proteins repeat-containing protein [Tieghemostelium lacteum]|uniref:7-fold repeat in clathrin and VPS proteins repeat-containing protein n=1 Tax=Tieghemostelium lacteum TaxID=361077 RepID=A0A151ZJ34_TIELA|nr:7-fold repeat in clathrin and VPS proteins repeat-containing protein [Tieghemostelium lacteum]|eukprot:KYQ94001.1 7-fold repeat in clathrin and VPS proteins repeat-containing protein [Tieghemostelium lacteum]
MATINLNFDSIKEIDLGDDFDSPPIQFRQNTVERGYQEPKPRINILETISDEGIFEMERLEYKPSGLLSMVISNGQIVMATQQSSIIRLDVNFPQELKSIEGFTNKNEKIHKIFLDPTGMHLIISMDNRDVYYYHPSFQKPKLQKSWKINLIESVAWDPKEDNPVMQTVIIGTNNGMVYEAQVVGQEKGLLAFPSKEPILKTLYQFDEPEPIYGLSLKKIVNKYFLLVSTPTRLYYLIGGPTFENLFRRDHVIFDMIPDDSPNRDLYGELKFHGTTYAWLISSGINHGELVYGSQGNGEKFTQSATMLHFQEDKPKDIDSRGKPRQFQSEHPLIPPYPPISFAMTQFHFLLLYEDRFIALGKLNNQIVYEISFSQKDPKLKGIAVDNEKNTIWIYGDHTILELVVQDEDRNAWKHYMDRGQFENALSYVKEPYIAEKKDQIWATQADHYFSEGKYELAATFYGKTHKVFEEITLKFINAGQRDALKTYLLQKLLNLGRNTDTQKTIISTWLVEIFISKLNTLRDPRDEDRYKKVSGEFRQFLENFKDTLLIIKDIIFNIISSHGAIEELLFYANLIEDYERVISYHIQHQQYDKALYILTTLDKPRQQQQQHPQQRHLQSIVPQTNPDELYYKFCPVLFHFIPYQTCDAWIQTKPNFLNPRKLIPSLMRYDHSKTPFGQPNQAIRYLQHCVQRLRNKDKAVHNYLLSLYVKQDDDKPILDFLGASEFYYDLKYALRLCMKEKKLKACVLIYSAMELYEEAVDLALEVDIDLATENADKLRETDEALCKKLWLRIAKHVVEKGKDKENNNNKNIKEAMEFLKNCDLLKIEDILPFFSDFTVIDDFKEEICKSLEDYNSYIDELKLEMDDATESAKLIRNDIQNLRNKYGYVRSDQKCDICNYPVLTKRFYLFNCQHVFHSDCLITELMKHKSNDQKQRIRELQMSLQAHESHNHHNQTTTSAVQNHMSPDQTIDASMEDSNRNELDRIVGKECIYCGDLMIRLIEKPFISPDEKDILASWEI